MNSATTALATMLVLAPLHAQKPTCRTAILEAEVNKAQSYTHPIGNNLQLILQPIHSGWILRVLPINAPFTDRDYATLATPPYNSVTPLSISTDFAFRAQDAIGWNPRRFRFATSPQAFQKLDAAYTAQQANPQALAAQIAQASDAVFTILDARLVPGQADQQRMAAAVSSRFTETAHTLADAPQPSPLGSIEWFRFRVEFELPPDFRAAPGQRIVPHPCGTR